MQTLAKCFNAFCMYLGAWFSIASPVLNLTVLNLTVLNLNVKGCFNFDSDLMHVMSVILA
jgi:hypothetical protein